MELAKIRELVVGSMISSGHSFESGQREHIAGDGKGTAEFSFAHALFSTVKT